jgi:hypothetical protein
MHHLAAMTASIRLVHKNAQTSTRMHCLTAITALYKPKYTLRHMHASPRSNHREHTPCTSPPTNACIALQQSQPCKNQNTNPDTCMHGLAGTEVSMRHLFTSAYKKHIRASLHMLSRGSVHHEISMQIFVDTGLGVSQACYHFTTAAGGIHIALYVFHLQPW